ncbi:MAG: TolC family protein [Myxococcales bacterium]|nr:TolC family protein [Myxococcales bacterium]
MPASLLHLSLVLALAAPAKEPVTDPELGGAPLIQEEDDAPPPPPAAAEGPDEPVYEDPLVVALTPVAGGLTSDEVAKDALRSAPSIGLRTAELQQAAARVDKTMVAYLPSLTGTASYTRLSKVNVDLGGGGSIVGAMNPGPLVVAPCPGGVGQCVVDSGGVPVGAAPFAFSFPLNSFSLQAQLAIPISDYILSMVPAWRSSKATKEAVRLAREAEIIKVEVDARLAYYNWLRTVAAVVVAEESIARSQARLADAQASFEAGVVSKADVLRLDSLVASTEAGVVQARALRELAAKHLAVMMNREGADFTVGEDVLADLRPAKAEALDDLVREAHERRRELLSLRQSGRAVDQGVRSIRAMYYPRLDGFAEGTYANPNQRFFPLQNKWNASWSVGVRLSYSLSQTLRTRAEVKDLKADGRKLAHQEEALRRGITMEVTQAYLDRQNALAAIELGGRAVRSSEEAYRVAADLYQAGTATTTDIIDAEVARVTTTLQEVNARIDLRVAELRLRYSVGRLEPIEAPAEPASGRRG